MPTMVKRMAHTAAKAVSARENGITTASSSPSTPEYSAPREDTEEEERVSFCTSQMYGSCT